MKTVLVLDANQRSALAVTRSLGKKNIPVITADETASSLAGCSRYSRKYIQYPSALNEAANFIQHIKQACIDNKIDIIMPMTELTSALMLSHRDEISNISLPFANSETVRSLSDKCQLMKLAQSLDIPIPETTHVMQGHLHIPDMSQFAYPLVLKPGLSWLETDEGWIHTEVNFAHNQDAAISILKHDKAFQFHPYMLQTCVPGHGEGIFALYDNGHAVAFFAHRRIREKPPRGGVSVLSQSVLPNPKLREYAKKLLDASNWHGVAMVEFRVDDEGNANLMEVNTRFWGSLQLAVDSGVDFPWLLYKIACGKQVESIEYYKIGQRLRWLLGDIDSLYLLLRDTDITIQKKLVTSLRFLTPHPFSTRHETNRFSDLKPAITELIQYIKALFH